MAKLTITDAARVTGVSRMLLYRYIKSGKLSRTPDGLIDTAELLRAGLMLHTGDVTRPVTPLRDVTPSSVTSEPSVTTPVTSTVTSPVTPAVSTETGALERLITVLQRELDAARERETLLLQMLSQMQQQNQRLLDMPRSTPLPSLQDAPGATQSRRRPQSPPPSQKPPRGQPRALGGDARGAMRRRIVALLQAHPEGLGPAQTRRLLGIEKDLGPTMKAMARDGLLRRAAHGRYGAASDS
jgi:AcrR family transcriptional regulator